MHGFELAARAKAAALELKAPGALEAALVRGRAETAMILAADRAAAARLAAAKTATVVPLRKAA